MNVISLGYRCSTADGLKFAGRRCTAFPFDYLKSPLPSTVSVLKRLKSPDFNMQQLLKEFFSVCKSKQINSLGFDVGHFTFRQWKAWLSSECTESDINISEEDMLKCESIYRLNDKYCIVSHPKVYKIFERRFNRLKDMFFTQENILVYSDIQIYETLANHWEPSIKELMSLNPLNRLIYITYADRQLLLPLVDRVEVHRLDKNSYPFGPSYRNDIAVKIACIFKNMK